MITKEITNERVYRLRLRLISQRARNATARAEVETEHCKRSVELALRMSVNDDDRAIELALRMSVRRTHSDVRCFSNEST